MVWEDPAKSVRKPPGSMIVTLIPSGPTSLASTSEKPSTPHLAAAYAPRPNRADASSHGRELEDPARSLASHHQGLPMPIYDSPAWLTSDGSRMLRPSKITRPSSLW